MTNRVILPAVAGTAAIIFGASRLTYQAKPPVPVVPVTPKVLATPTAVPQPILVLETPSRPLPSATQSILIHAQAPQVTVIHRPFIPEQVNPFGGDASQESSGGLFLQCVNNAIAQIQSTSDLSQLEAIAHNPLNTSGFDIQAAYNAQTAYGQRTMNSAIGYLTKAARAKEVGGSGEDLLKMARAQATELIETPEQQAQRLRLTVTVGGAPEMRQLARANAERAAVNARVPAMLEELRQQNKAYNQGQ